MRSVKAKALRRKAREITKGHPPRTTRQVYRKLKKGLI